MNSHLGCLHSLDLDCMLPLKLSFCCLLMLACTADYTGPDLHRLAAPPKEAAKSIDTWLIFDPVWIEDIVTDPTGACFDVYEGNGETYYDHACGGVSFDPPLLSGAIFAYEYGDPWDELLLYVDTVPSEDVITFACDAESLERGTDISCEIGLEGRHLSIVQTEWRFEPEQSSGLPTIEPQPDTSRTWAGTMVMSGAITVDAQWASGGVSNNILLQAQVSVTPRQLPSWHTRIDTAAATAADCSQGQTIYDYDPSNNGTVYGWTIGSHSGGCVNPWWFLKPYYLDGDGGIDIREIPTGPNSSYFYVLAIRDSLAMAWARHPHLLPGAAAAYSLDTTLLNGLGAYMPASCKSFIGSSVLQRSVYWVNTSCMQNDASYLAFVAFVGYHESCHMQRAIAEFQGPQVMDVPAEYEDAIRPTASAAADLRNDVIDDLIAANTQVRHYSSELDSAGVVRSDTFPVFKPSAAQQWQLWPIAAEPQPSISLCG